MSSEYYSLEKAAEVLALPTAEVNRLREKNQLRAFRDGSSWKFRKVDVDNYLAESIKNRSKNEKSAGESDFDLLSMDDDEESPTLLADLPSFDSLMEDGVSLDDKMIDAVPSSPVASKITQEKNILDKKNDIPVMDDDLMLSSDDLILSDDSNVLPDSLSASKASASDIDLAADNDLVLDGNGSSGQLNLAGDSGLSLLDITDNIDLQPVEKGGSDAQLELDDNDDILSLIGDDLVVDGTSTIAIPVEDDFQLTPDTTGTGIMAADDSESASQVIALDEDNMFATSDGSSGFGAEIPFAPATSAATEEPTQGASFGATPFTSAPAGEFVARTPEMVSATTEFTYTSWHIFWIVFATVFLILPGMMILDLIIHIWSWGEPFVINSSIMDILVGMWHG
ncbi:MAG: helix-turn-helix domain-containing protein [Planctomycetaceae bacterium]|jgi:excisionase family DNA binding protein|nr:helix-turn-helix domain-containing protein [Planctomycetaceae bacterium]